jgi:hypothetical protein
MFDGLCCRAYEGLFPEPKFEPSVLGGKLSGVPDSRAGALMHVDEMKRAIGSEAFSILFHRIHMDRPVPSEGLELNPNRTFRQKT